MNKALTVVKGVGGLVISAGIGAIATNLIKHTTPADTKKIMNICIGVGGFFVSGMCAAAASDQFEGTIDKIANTIKVWTDGKEEPVEEQTEEEETE